MSAVEILKDIAPKGIKLWVENEKLKYEAIEPLPSDMIAQLKIHKQEVMKMLREFVTGYECPCGNSIYRPRTFVWKDMKGFKHWGYTCQQCETRYWMV